MIFRLLPPLSVRFGPSVVCRYFSFSYLKLWLSYRGFQINERGFCFAFVFFSSLRSYFPSSMHFILSSIVSNPSVALLYLFFSLCFVFATIVRSFAHAIIWISSVMMFCRFMQSAATAAESQANQKVMKMSFTTAGEKLILERQNKRFQHFKRT